MKINFEQLFNQISANRISDNVFSLVGEDYFAITAGKIDNYNSMIGSGGGLGMLFRKPSAWCILKSDRYTLELLKQEQTYTLSYFPPEHKEQMLFLGSKSGRNSDKMKENLLTTIQTPSGNISFEESKLIFECKLTQITTPLPDDFCSQEAIDYLSKAYNEASDYRKYVFGEITHTWIKR